jgi:ABC-2 type transport system ATP-binding protein/lipopolysaccharide transport system ATP-binding protein
MSFVRLEGVHVDLPLFQAGGRSLKKALLHAGKRSRIAQGAGRAFIVHALKNISLEFAHGERIGLVGSNGAGKTTLLRVIAGTYTPTAGEVTVDGRVASLLDAGLGLDPDATGFENIKLRGIYMGLSLRQIAAVTDEVAAFTELEDFLALPLRTYSSGMQLRLAFAVATCVEREIVVMDEWLLAGDAGFIDKARERLSRFVDRSSIVVVASHAQPILRQWCSKAVLLEKGQVIMFGPVDEVLDAYSARLALPKPAA